MTDGFWAPQKGLEDANGYLPCPVLSFNVFSGCTLSLCYFYFLNYVKMHRVFAILTNF